MTLKNTTLDDIAAVVGFSAALRLSAWYGEGSNVWIPVEVEEGQMLVRLLGISAAKRLSKEWPGEFLAIPRPQQYDSDVQRRQITELLTNSWTPRRIGHFLRLGERRVQQIIRELETAGIIAPIAPVEKTPAKMPLKKTMAKMRGKNRVKRAP